MSSRTTTLFYLRNRTNVFTHRFPSQWTQLKRRELKKGLVLGPTVLLQRVAANASALLVDSCNCSLANSATPCSSCTRCCSCCTCYSNSSPSCQTCPARVGVAGGERRRSTALATPWMRPAERGNGWGSRRRRVRESYGVAKRGRESWCALRNFNSFFFRIWNVIKLIY